MKFGDKPCEIKKLSFLFFLFGLFYQLKKD